VVADVGRTRICAGISRFSGHQAPLVVITAAHDAKQYAEKVEADGYLSKPFDLDMVLATVGELIGDQDGGGLRNSSA
jgi:DNA-binding response OmpR family regulator